MRPSHFLHVPDEKTILAWLPRLLDSFALAVTAVAIAVRDIEKRLGKTHACREGYNVCCHQPDIQL